MSCGRYVVVMDHTPNVLSDTVGGYVLANAELPEMVRVYEGTQGLIATVNRVVPSWAVQLYAVQAPLVVHTAPIAAALAFNARVWAWQVCQIVAFVLLTVVYRLSWAKAFRLSDWAEATPQPNTTAKAKMIV